MTIILFNTLNCSIIGLFIDNENSFLHGRGIARKLNKNQRTVQLALNSLHKNNILAMKKVGRNKEYNINLEKPNIKSALMVAESYKAQNLFENHFEISKIIDDVTKLTNSPTLIFGSYAKGYNVKGSDLDILVIQSKRIDITKIQHKYALKIHLITVSEDKFESSLTDKKSFAVETILNHVICQGHEYFVDRWEKNYG